MNWILFEKLKNIWRRIIEIEMQRGGYDLNSINRIVNDRSRWKDIVVVLCVKMYEENLVCK